jgi:glutaredoxin-like YruB-family protein
MGKNVVIYSTPTCPWCQRVKQFMQEHNIFFQDFDVSQNQEKAEEMVQKSGQMGVPVVDVGGEIIVGFDKDKIEDALEL